MKPHFALDEIDRKILSALQLDASISHAELGQEVGASPASCWRRIKALEAAGILGKAVRLVDAHRIGKGVSVLCSIRMKSHAMDARRAFEKFVERRPEIVECFSMSGDWDYLLHVVVSGVADYNLFLMEAILSHPSVAGASSHFALSKPKYTTAIPI